MPGLLFACSRSEPGFENSADRLASNSNSEVSTESTESISPSNSDDIVDTETADFNTAEPLYKFSSSKVRGVKLPKELAEISGLACSPDGRLFAHNDEVGTIYEIDPAAGSVVKNWRLGPQKVKEDFEGIAFNNGVFFLTTSNGDIYRFTEGTNGETVSYTTFTSGLSEKNNVEGLCYDAATNALLLACKDDPGDELEDSRAIYRVALPLGSAATELYLTLSLEDLTSWNSNSEFRPSGIEIHPATQSLYVIAARGNSLAVLTSAGILQSQFDLPKKLHAQPEGISIAPNGTVYIANEGSGGRALLYSFAPDDW